MAQRTAYAASCRRFVMQTVSACHSQLHRAIHTDLHPQLPLLKCLACFLGLPEQKSREEETAPSSSASTLYSNHLEPSGILLCSWGYGEWVVCVCCLCVCVYRGTRCRMGPSSRYEPLGIQLFHIWLIIGDLVRPTSA